MTAPVDVLAVLTSTISIMGNLPQNPGYNGSVLLVDDTEAERTERDLLTVRDVLASLIDASYAAEMYVMKAADAVDTNLRVAGKANSLNVARVVQTNLSAALARCKGGAA